MGRTFLSWMGLMTIEDRNAIETKLQSLADNVQTLAKEINVIREQIQSTDSRLSQMGKSNIEYNDEYKHGLSDIRSTLRDIMEFHHDIKKQSHKMEIEHENWQNTSIRLLEKLQQCYDEQKKATEEYNAKTCNFLSEIAAVLNAQYKNISCIDANINVISENYVKKQDIKTVEDFLRLIIANQLMDNIDLNQLGD